MIVGCGDLTILLVGLGFHCFLLKCKEKLRHSLGRPSRSDFVQLEFMPRQHELDEDEELALRGIRKCYYKNYKIYFFIDEKNGIVCVLRVLHMLVNAKPLLLNIGF